MQSCLDSIPDHIKRLVLAFSGGLDSCVLLHLITQQADSFKIIPWHVNHGLQDSADEMEAFCRSIASKYNLELKTSHLQLNRHAGNLESRAREARYDLFQQELKSTDCLLTAHHANDQVETFLLNALRGSGSAGLRGIAKSRSIGQATLLRPLHKFSRDEISCYANQHKLKWIDDPSNASDQFERNYLRHRVIPLIKDRWPGYLGSIHSVTEIQAETETLLKQMATEDYTRIQQQSGQKETEIVPIPGLLELDPVRQKNLIRFWLKLNSCPSLPQGRLNELVNQVQGEKGSGTIVHGTKYSVRTYNQCLFIVPDEAPPVLNADYEFDRSAVLNIEAIGLEVERKEVFKYLGKNDTGQSIKIMFRVVINSPNPAQHRLKRLFQKHKVPPWKRAVTPQIYLDNELIELWL